MSARASSQLLRNSASSYGRLLGTFIIGLIVTPYLARADHMGLAGFGLFALLMSSVGLINILQSTVRDSLVRDLSRAYQTDDPREMQAAFTAAFAACTPLAIGLAAVMMLGTPLALRIFQFAPHFADQMFWSWITLSVYTGWVVFTVPFITLFDASHRIPLRNLELFLERAASLIAAIIVFSHPLGRAYPLFGYILGNCAITGLVRLVCMFWAYLTCANVGIRYKALDLHKVREVFRTGSQVGQSEIANNLYDRTNQLLINISLGAALNGIFGVVVLLVGYTKQIAMGISFGIEPLAARFTHRHEDSKQFIGPFLLSITRIQAGMIFPIIAVLFMMGQLLVNFWLGDKFSVQRYAANRDIAQMLMILLVGSPFFVIMQGPLRIMLGAGDVRAYASRLLQAGVVQAIIAALILFFVPDLILESRMDTAIQRGWAQGGLTGNALLYEMMHARLFAENVAMYAVAASMSLIYLIVYGLYVPLLACRLYDLSWRDMYIRSMLPGAAIGALVGVLLGWYRWVVQDWSIWMLILGIALAGLISATCFWFVVLSAFERDRLLQMLLPARLRSPQSTDQDA